MVPTFNGNHLFATSNPFHRDLINIEEESSTAFLSDAAPQLWAVSSNFPVNIKEIMPLQCNF